MITGPLTGPLQRGLTGPLVLRGLGAGGATPPWMLPNVVAVWDDGDVVVSGGKITQINERCGSGKHAVQANATYQATLAQGAMFLAGRRYNISGGGITGLDRRSVTLITVYKDFAGLTPNNGTILPSGCLWWGGAGNPRVIGSTAYSSSDSPATNFYVPARQFDGGSGLSYYAAVYKSGTIRYRSNGVAKDMATGTGAATFTLTDIFGQADDFGGLFCLIKAVMVFNGQLTDAEIDRAVSYYRAKTSPASTCVYCLSTSTALGIYNTSYRDGAVPRFAEAIGAALQNYAQGGIDWAAQTNITSAAVQIYPDQEDVHLVMPQSNNLAKNDATTVVTDRITAFVNTIKGVRPNAKFILCPITPRNASFTNGATQSSYNTGRHTIRDWMSTNAPLLSTGGAQVVVADYYNTPEIYDDASISNMTYFHTDFIHMVKPGHDLMLESLVRAYESFT